MASNISQDRSSPSVAFVSQKRIYSKHGCKECKRRKIKCDEGKPSCWQCIRLRKDCSYPKPGEKVLRISRKKQREQLIRQEEAQNHSLLLQQQYRFEQPHSIITTHAPSTSSNSSQDSYRDTRSPNPIANSAPMYQQQHLPQNHYQPQFQPPPPPPQQQQYPSHQPLVHQQPQPVPPPPPAQQLSPSHQQYQMAPPSISYYPNPPSYMQYPAHIIQAGPHTLPQNVVPNHPNPPPPPPPPPIVPQQPPQPYPQNNHSVVLPPPQAAKLPIAPLPDHLNKRLQNPAAAPSLKARNSRNDSTNSIPNLLNDTNVLSDSNTISGAGNTPQTPPQQNSNNNIHIEHSQFSNDDIVEYYNQNDLEVLATDLNNIVSEIMFDFNFVKDKNPPLESEDGSLRTATSTNGSPPPLETAPSSHHNVPIDFIHFKKESDRTYFETFYNEFAQIILPFPSFDKHNKCYFNPARDIILRSAAKVKYLLAAVLANGARQQFNKTKSEEDEQAYCFYLSRCLELLGPAIANDDKELASNIENVLLTVLLLTAGNASNLRQDWRSHLKGAKDLLVKNSPKSTTKRKHSKVFIFCKIWFVTIEVLAGISSQKGGTLQTEQEIDELINSGDEYEQQVLKELGIILDNGFNIMGGYQHECYNYFGKLIKILNQDRNGKLNPQESFEYIKLFVDLERQRNLQFVDKRGSWVTSSNSEDNNNDAIDEKHINSLLVERVPTTDNKSQVISWMDVSHQAYTMALMITVLEKCFRENYSNPQIQLLSDSIIQFVDYLYHHDVQNSLPKHKIESALMMLQWPLLVAGRNIASNGTADNNGNTPETIQHKKDVVIKFFEASSKVGSGGALIASKIIQKIWNKRDNIEESDNDDNENEDLLSY
ncbi:hypothetical protein MGC_00886 [Candida albicans P37039]|nr:hypothetical protein MGC_00886 [Candida albicans P37039]